MKIYKKIWKTYIFNGFKKFKRNRGASTPEGVKSENCCYETHPRNQRLSFEFGDSSNILPAERREKSSKLQNHVRKCCQKH